MLEINKKLELKLSFEWIKSSFYIFRESPIPFIVLGLFALLASILQIMGSFLSPLIIAQFARLVTKIENREEVLFSETFKGLFENKTVVRLAMMSFTLSIVLLFIQLLVEYTYAGNNLTPENIFVVYIFLIPAFIIQLSLWLSPIICLKHPEIKVLDAMKLSIKACIYNVPTFLLYSLFVVLFSILALLPIGLGLLIWLPMLNIGSYLIYKDIYIK